MYRETVDALKRTREYSLLSETGRGRREYEEEEAGGDYSRHTGGRGAGTKPRQAPVNGGSWGSFFGEKQESESAAQKLARLQRQKEALARSHALEAQKKAEHVRTQQGGKSKVAEQPPSPKKPRLSQEALEKIERAKRLKEARDFSSLLGSSPLSPGLQPRAAKPAGEAAVAGSDGVHRRKGGPDRAPPSNASPAKGRATSVGSTKAPYTQTSSARKGSFKSPAGSKTPTKGRAVPVQRTKAVGKQGSTDSDRALNGRSAAQGAVRSTNSSLPTSNKVAGAVRKVSAGGSIGKAMSASKGIKQGGLQPPNAKTAHPKLPHGQGKPGAANVKLPKAQSCLSNREGFRNPGASGPGRPGSQTVLKGSNGVQKGVQQKGGWDGMKRPLAAGQTRPTAGRPGLNVKRKRDKDDDSMDSFVVSDEDDGGASEYRAAQRAIRKMFGYDPSKRAIYDNDVDDMEVGFRRIQAEEAKSARIGRDEDEREAALLEAEERRRKAKKKKQGGKASYIDG